MLRVIETFNGHNLNDGVNYRATILNALDLPAAQNVFVAHANADSDAAGVYLVETGTIVISVKILDYANRLSLMAQLQGWCKRGTRGDLVVTFLDDSLSYLKDCQVVDLVPEPEHPLRFNLTLNTGATTWRAVNADTYSWNLTGTGGTHALNLQGDDSTPLNVTFTLTTQPSTGYLYQALYQLVNNAALGFGPLTLTIDTTGLVADNTNKCQINGAIDATQTTIPYDTVTGIVPSAGMGYIGTEQIKWTGKTGTTSGDLTGVTRHIGGTSAATHADNSEIKVSYLLANGYDLRPQIDGVETNRWISGMNTSTTKIWININLSKGYSLVLLTAITGTGDITSMSFAKTVNTKNAIAALPQEGIIIHGTEWIKYRKPENPLYNLNVIERGVLGTTRQTHSASSAFVFQEHVITLVFGNSNAVDPSTLDANYDDMKPVFDLSSSTNASWVYTASTVFWDLNGTGRTGGWTPFISYRNGPDSGTYDFKENADSGDSAMGMFIEAFLRSAGFVAEHALVGFSFYRGCGVQTVSMTGEKYRGDSAWGNNNGLRKSANGQNWVSLWSEATPTSILTFKPFTHNSVAIGGARWIRVQLGGNTNAARPSVYSFEILTATIAFVSGNLPTGTLLARTNNAQLELTFANNTNEDSLDITLPMLEDLDLVLDNEAGTVLYNNVNAHDAMTLNDASRDWWIRLQKGTNNLEITSEDVGALTALLSWYKRRF